MGTVPGSAALEKARVSEQARGPMRDPRDGRWEVGHVTKLTGTAYAVEPNGRKRLLAEGDDLICGESLLAEKNSRVEMKLKDPVGKTTNSFAVSSGPDGAFFSANELLSFAHEEEVSLPKKVMLGIFRALPRSAQEILSGEKHEDRKPGMIGGIRG